MDMTQLFAAFPQLSMMGGQQNMQTGTPQMAQMQQLQQINTDPNAAANLQADAIKLRQNMDMANALMQQGGNYIPNSGKAGIAAGLASLIRGKMMQSGQDESMRDILSRQFDMQNKDAQAKRQQDLEDEQRKMYEEIYKGTETAKGKAKAERDFAKPEFTGGGVFDPTTGQFTPSGDWMQQQLALKEGQEKLGAKYRQGPADPFAKFKTAVAQGILTPEQAQQAMQRELMGGGGGSVPSGYRPNAAGTGLEPIPGGPADPSQKAQALQPVSAENRAKLGLLDAAQGSLDKYVNTGTQGGTPTPWKNMGVGNVANTSMEDAIANMLRVESGAAISQGEISAAKDRYMPSPLRSDAENKNRLDLLKNKLEKMRSALTTGTNEQSPQAQGGHKVGDVITVNGKQYKVTGGDPNDPDVAPL